MVKTNILYRFSIVITLIVACILEAYSQNDYEYVDLGLSVKWATKNIGASQTTDFGNYFAWGETSSKEEYDWTTYKYTEEKATKMTKYCYSSLGAVKDFLDILEPADDAATSLWRQQWRMPTLDEMNELLQNCTWIWSNDYQGSGKAGYIVRSKIDGFQTKSIFLPAAGHWGGKNPYDINQKGMYWTSSLNFESFASLQAAQLYFGNNGYQTMSYDRQIGMTIRPVLNEVDPNRPKDYTITGKIQGFDYVDLGLSVLWATANVGALIPKVGGSLFSWGETSTKEVYSDKTYTLSSDGQYDHMAKYNKRDNLTTLEPCDDAATYNWGDRWRTPTIDEWTELLQNCDWELKLGAWYGTSKVNGNVIIISNSTGCRDDYTYRSLKDGGHYWSSNNSDVDKHRGWAMICQYYMYTTRNINRFWGMAIRPVANKDLTDIQQMNTEATKRRMNKLYVKDGKIVLRHNNRLYNINGAPIQR